MKSLNKKLGEEMRSIRQSEDLSILSLAIKMKVDPATVSRLETDKQKFDADKIEVFCRAVKMGPEEFVYRAVKS